jgi:hypothetical protein
MNWFQKTAAEFRLQMQYGRINRTWREAQAEQRRLVDAMIENTDYSVRTVERRLRENHGRLFPHEEAAVYQETFRHQKNVFAPLRDEIKSAAERLEALGRNVETMRTEGQNPLLPGRRTVAVLPDDYEGKGIGAFFGRLFSGRAFGRNRNELPGPGREASEFKEFQAELDNTLHDNQELLPACEDENALAQAIGDRNARYDALTQRTREERISAGLESVRAQPSAALRRSREFEQNLERDRTELCKALYGVESTGKMPQTGQIRMQRSGVNIGAALLFTQGHSFEDILNPDKLQMEKLEAGRQIKQWVEMGNSNDPNVKNASAQAISEVYQQFGQRYNTLKGLNIDHKDAPSLSLYYRELEGRGNIAWDIGQEIMQVRQEVTGRVGQQEFDKISGPMIATSQPYTLLANSVGGAARAADSTQSSATQQLAQAAALAVHLRGETGAVFNANRDKPMEQLDGMAMTYKINAVNSMIPNSLTANGNANLQRTVLNLCYDNDVLVSETVMGTNRAGRQVPQVNVSVDYQRGVNINSLPQEPAPAPTTLSIHDFEPAPARGITERANTTPERQRGGPQAG